MDNIAIKVEGVSKVFKLPHEKQSSIKSTFINVLSTKRSYEQQQALDKVSFEVNKGEFFGIVGRNGSGKSTLLKLLAGIYAPSEGDIQVNGKLTPFIELGVGFNPELTGRENVYLNGALLGFNRKEMRHMYKDIVNFAELGKFMDQKLKNYSSGMQVRLAFSIAIRAKSDILLFDEVLAVGDAAFQRKCYEVFKDLKRKGVTVVLVTHDMSNVEKFCDRVLVMAEGKALDITTPANAITEYSQLNIGGGVVDSEVKRWGSGEITVDKVYSPGKKELNKVYKYGDPLEIIIKLTRHKDHAKTPVIVGLAFVNQDDITVAGPNSLEQKQLSASSEFRYILPKIQFAPGDYKLTVAVYDPELTSPYDFLDRYFKFNVISDKAVHGLIDLNGKWSNGKKD
jgi:ABC-2 type transport system ATP-binding protein